MDKGLRVHKEHKELTEHKELRVHRKHREKTSLHVQAQIKETTETHGHISVTVAEIHTHTCRTTATKHLM